MNTVTYFPQDWGEFFLASVTKHNYKNKHEFDTLLCWVRIVKSFEKQSTRKDDQIHRLYKIHFSLDHSLLNLLLATLSELVFLVVWKET